jgi:hypothetical protein
MGLARERAAGGSMDDPPGWAVRGPDGYHMAFSVESTGQD